MVSAFAALVFIGAHIFNGNEVTENERFEGTGNSTLSARWCCNSSIFNPLITASIRGYTGEVEKMLEKDPSDIENRDRSGLTPLQWASIMGQADVVDKLLWFGANISSVDDDHNTALHMAAVGGKLEVVRILLANKSPIQKQNVFGDTPLHLAVSKGYFDVAETLLSHGASTKICNNKRKTPLGLAVDTREEALIRLLRTASEHAEAHYWVEAEEKIPSDAVLAGNDPHQCNRSFVGRVLIDGYFVPAKVCPHLKRAFAAYKGLEFISEEYQFQVLTSNHAAWRTMSDEYDIPYEAIVGGSTSTGEKLYIGRSYVLFEGVLYLVPGKVRGSNRRLFVPLFGKVFDKTNYEILVSY